MSDIFVAFAQQDIECGNRLLLYLHHRFGFLALEGAEGFDCGFAGGGEVLEGMATIYRADVHHTRAFRKAIDDLRRVRGGQILQNKPTNPAPILQKFSTEPKENRS